MKKTLTEPVDITLLAAGWYELVWRREQLAPRLRQLKSIARQMGDDVAVFAPATSDDWVTRHQLRSFFEKMTQWRLAKVERRYPWVSLRGSRQV